MESVKLFTVLRGSLCSWDMSYQQLVCLSVEPSWGLRKEINPTHVMATFVRGARCEVTLDSNALRADDDASTSPHLNTLKDKLEAKPEVVLPRSIIESSSSNTIGINDKNDFNTDGTFDLEGSEQVLQADLALESLNNIERTVVEDDLTSSENVHHLRAFSSSSLERNDLNLHNFRPIPSSSIPHLLRSSISSQTSIEGTAKLSKQLSFLGIDAELPSSSLDNSNKSCIKEEINVTTSMSPYDMYDLPQCVSPMDYRTEQSVKQAHRFHDFYKEIPSNPNSSSPMSESASNRTSGINELLYMNTPPHVLGTTTHSPHSNVSCEAINHPLTVMKLHSHYSPDFVTSKKVFSENCSLHGVSSTVKGDHETEHSVSSSTDAVHKQSNFHPQQIEYRSRKPSYQPVLYSAFNSLERYNAASFENKVLLEKAYGKYGVQKAFPGVPTKTDNKTTDSSDSAGESRGSSVSYLLNSEKGWRDDDGSKSLSTSSYCGDAMLFKLEAERDNKTRHINCEQQVHINGEQSDGKLIRSKSSGNLADENVGGEASTHKVTIDCHAINEKGYKPKKRNRREKKVGVFRPSSDAYTPRMEDRSIKYKPAQERESVEKMSLTMGTIQRPNFRDALRRVAIILNQHILKIERRFETGIRGLDDTGLFKASMRDYFSEHNFATPRYKCSIVRVPMARPGVVFSMRKIRTIYHTPTTDEIYEFAHQLFKKVQLSSECSIVCLIYVEKLMEVAKVPLVSSTWRPIFMCGLLLASKVWQDLSSWNIEFASVYPQFSLEAINRLELQFLKSIKWDLYISSSLYAKYYFALRSLLEKSGFRERYNQMVGGIGGIAASEAMKVSKRSEAVKEEALLQLSRSM